MKRKPPGYWFNWNNIERELREVIENEYKDENGNVIKPSGEFPKEVQLVKTGKNYLLHPIRKYFGGIPNVRKRMGFEPSYKPDGYWDDWSNVEKELREVIGNEYRDSEGVLIKAAGEFPIITKLERVGKGNLACAIYGKHDGMDAARKRMGYKSSQKPKGYWKNWENVERELLEVIENEYRNTDGSLIKAKGEFPTQKQLSMIGKLGIASAIFKYHGGAYAIRKRMGFEPYRKPDGYWDNWDNLRMELEEVANSEYRDENGHIIKRAGEFPTQEQLSKIGRCNIEGAMERHGGLSSVRGKMGFKELQKPHSYWNDWGNLENELKLVIKNQYVDKDGNIIKNAGEFPTTNQLARINRHDMINALHKHNGISAICKRMGFKLKCKPNGYWSDWNNVEKELREVIDNEYRDSEGVLIKAAGEFPTTNQLKKIEEYGLLDAILKHDGMNNVRQRMGYELIKYPRNYWDNFENVDREFREVIENEYRTPDGTLIKAAGEFPTYTQLKLIGKGALASGLLRHGGKNTVLQKMGYPINGQIKTPQAFTDFIETESDAKLILERFGGDDADVADIMAVVYEGRISREDAMLLMQDPSLRDYLGRFQRPWCIGDLFEAGERLLAYDKNNVIRDIVYRRALEYRSEQLGPKPTKEQRERFLQELDREIAGLVA